MQQISDYQTIEKYGVKLTVHYLLNGDYQPATYYQEAQYQDIIINEICAYDSSINLYDLFTEDQIDEIALNVQSYIEY
jgi:hypothetical protein